MRQDLSRGLRGLIERLGLWLARGALARETLHMLDVERRAADVALELGKVRGLLFDSERAHQHTREQLASAERKLRKTKPESPISHQERASLPMVIERLTKRQRAFIGREAERFAELKYRQLKQHFQHLKAELNARHTGPSESSAYLECLELFAQIPQLRHIATRYLHEQNAAAIEQDVQALLDNVPWLRKLAEQDPMGIRLIGDPARD